MRRSSSWPHCWPRSSSSGDVPARRRWRSGSSPSSYPASSLRRWPGRTSSSCSATCSAARLTMPPIWPPMRSPGRSGWPTRRRRSCAGYRSASGIVLLFAGVVVARRDDGWPAAAVLGTTGLLLLPPVLWYHYLAMLLPVAIIAWRPASARGRTLLVAGGVGVTFGLAWLPDRHRRCGRDGRCIAARGMAGIAPTASPVPSAP